MTEPRRAGPRVLVGAASPALRAGLRALVRAAPGDLALVEEGPEGPPDADVLLLDEAALLALDVLAGLPPPGVVALSLSEEAAEAVRRLHPPGWALVPTDVTEEELGAAILAAAAGLAAAPARWADALLPAPEAAARPVALGGEALTPRERDVLGLLSAGEPNKRIASRLGVTENTVKYHLSALYGKLGVSSRAGAVREGLRRGLVSV